MRVVCVGAGPAGLTTAIALARSGHEVTVLERRSPGDDPGWGVVLSDALDQLAALDPASARAVRGVALPWRGRVLDVEGRGAVHLDHSGHSTSRWALVQALTGRARELGVRVHHDSPVDGAVELAAHDLVVAADGAASPLRTESAAAFGVDVDVRPNRFAWLGTDREVEQPTTAFRRTAAGWVWVHAFAVEPGASSVVVEAQSATWSGLGLGELDDEAALGLLEGVFADVLDGHALAVRPGSRTGLRWSRFTTVSARRWHHGNLVLVGDAAHTTHFSTGSGTALAIGDAVALAASLERHGGDAAELPQALAAYGRARRAQVWPAQAEACASGEWFEQAPRSLRASPAHLGVLFDRRGTRVQRRLPLAVYLALSGAAAVAPDGVVRALGL